MISKMNKIYFILIILVVLIVSGVGLYLKSNSESNSDEGIASYQYQIDKPQLLSYSNGKKRWHIESETITQPKTEDKEKTKVILKDIKEGKLYSDDNLEYKVDAAKIVYFEQSKNIELYDDVKLEEVGGDKIFSDFFMWNDKQKNLKTDDGVRVKMKNGKLSANKMNFNLETEVIDFVGDVTMTFKIEGAGNDEE